MNQSIDIDELSDEHEQRLDFRRANGSPMVTDPDNTDKFLRYRRPSSFGKPLDDENALTEWRIFKAMEGVARSKALQTEVAACKDEDRVTKKELREKALDRGAANERADMGTGLHAMTARIEDVSDTSFDPPEQFAADLEAYTSALSTYGLVSEYIEVQIVNDDFRAAGTADRIFRTTKRLVAPDGEIIEPGALILGDLKTGEKLDFGLPAYCVQLAIYATGVFYDVAANKRLPTPEINKNWTILIHLPYGEGKATLLWCPISVGLIGAWLTNEVLDWRNKWKAASNSDFDCPPMALPIEEIVETFDAEVVSGDTPSLLDELREYCVERMAQIKGHAKAKEWTVNNWPGDLTPPKNIHDAGEMVRCLDFLDTVEKNFSLPFLQDPRRDMHRGARPGEHTVDELTSNARGLTE